MQVVEGLQFMSSAFSRLNTMLNQENKTKACCDFLEELKCLFLCMQNPQKSVFEELVYNWPFAKEKVIAFVDESATAYIL
ncbi:6336_t:CDS:2, partial [Cetraspora pellucida]